MAVIFTYEGVMFSREKSPGISLVIKTQFFPIYGHVFNMLFQPEYWFRFSFVDVLLMFLLPSARAFLEWGDHRDTQEDKVKGYVLCRKIEVLSTATDNKNAN